MTLRAVLFSESCFCRRIRSTFSLMDDLMGNQTSLVEYFHYSHSICANNYLSLSACCFLISFRLPSISFSFSRRVSLSAAAVSSSSAALTCSVTLDLLLWRRRVGREDQHLYCMDLYCMQSQSRQHRHTALIFDLYIYIWAKVDFSSN